MLKNYLKRYKLFVIFSFILVLLQSFCTLYQPHIISDIITELSKSEIEKSVVNQLGIVLIIVGVIGLIAGSINTIISAKISQSIGSDLREDGFNNIQRLTFQDIEKFTTSNLVVRLTNDVNQVQTMIMLGLQMLIRIPLLFIGAFTLAIMALPGLWWTIVLYVVIVFFISIMMGKIMGPRFGKVQKKVESINTVVKENIDGVRVVKSFVKEEEESKRFNKETDDLTENLIYIGKTFSIMIPTLVFTANILIGFAIYFVAGWAIEDPELIGSLVSFMTYIMQIMFAIMMGSFVMMSISRAIVSLKRIGEVIDAKPSYSFGNEELNEVQKIEFENVSFKYPGEDEYSLENISFVINKHETVGVVGATGSGKTTLVQLIPRLYDVTGGVIKINGKNIDRYKASSLRSNISIVLQKAHLFSGTIKDTILDGNKHASDLDIEIASKRAQAYEFIKKKEGELEGEVYQKGANFSGGQKQRLSIARGFVKKPNILILDDSTSALDAKSENLVKEAINQEFKDVMTIIVAQKISSVVDTDKIIVLGEGKIDAIGTHKELIKSSEVYKEIYETQKDKGGNNE